MQRKYMVLTFDGEPKQRYRVFNGLPFHFLNVYAPFIPVILRAMARRIRNVLRIFERFFPLRTASQEG